MDKRTLIFLLGMTIVFFVMHQWLDFGVGSRTPQIIQPQTRVVISGQAASSAPLTPSEQKEFQIANLYSDFDSKQFVTAGIKQKDTFLAIASSLNLPEFAYIEASSGNSSVAERFQLVIKPEKIGDPILYSVYPLSKLETPSILEEGLFDIFAIYFDGEKVYKIKGQTDGTEELTFSQKPPQNSILLIDIKGASNPYGYYEAESDQVNYFEHLPLFKNYSVVIYPQLPESESRYSNQEFYVLENEYLQLVFSTINGAVAEINLPFHSEKHPQSVVREIEIDRTIEKNYPDNNLFPQNSYYVPEGQGGQKKLNPTSGGYYPLLRRGIIGAEGSTTTTINPHYYAFNIFEKDHANLEPKIYTLKRFEKGLIEFELIEQNRKITKTFKLSSNSDEIPYCLDLAVKIDGDARNLSLNLGIPEVELLSGSFSPGLKYKVTRNNKPVIEDIKPPKGPMTFSHINADWYCDSNGFFGVILDPSKKTASGFEVLPISGELVPSRITIIDAQHQRYPTNKFPGYAMNTPIVSKAGTTNYHVFAGPFDKKTLQQVDLTYTDPKTGATPDYLGAKSAHGWFAFISQPFAKFLYVILDFFHSITFSWGISIILLTIVLRLILYPLNNWSMKSTAKLQKISPKVQAIQEKYKKDPKQAQIEVMNLYRKEGANPFGGCLPMIIQLPFLFGMFDLLKTSFELRGASFIPGWIDNLTAPDVLFSWQYPIPFFGTSFHLLPILLGVIMFFQQKMMSPTTASSNKAPTDQQRQQKFMGNIMTLVFTVLFYHFPSGLNIYWISSMLLGVLQQWWVNKQLLVIKEKK